MGPGGTRKTGALKTGTTFNDRIESEDLPYLEIRRKWRTHPRVGRPVKSRQFNNEELPWSECVNRFSDYYELAELHKWYLGLPRGRLWIVFIDQ